MIYDATDSENIPQKIYDICIVGSGPAALAIVADLSQSGLSICVIESGSLSTSAFADNLRTVESEGISIKQKLRERIFGGSTKTWDHLSAPLDAIDFERRAGAFHEGWPITSEELAPYLERAAQYFRFPDKRSFQDFLQRRTFEPLHPEWKNLQEKIFLSPVHPLRFGREFSSLFRIAGLDLILGLTAAEYISHTDSGKTVVEAVRCLRRDGSSFTMQAKYFVLATGGIENARILLNSKTESGISLGNQHDQVGRYFMNHPKGYAGSIRFNKPVPKSSWYFDAYWHKETQNFAGLRLRDEIQREQSILNHYVHLVPAYPWSDKRGIRALRTVVPGIRTFFRYLIHLRRFHEAWKMLPSVIINGLTTVLYLPQIMWYAAVKASHKGVRVARMRNHLEMEPDPENRIVLGKTPDALGIPIPIVRHTVSDLAFSSLEKLHRQISSELQELDVGSYIPPADFRSSITEEAGHHLGSTRMGDNPKTSVVDKHLRVHGVDNLFIAGGSVFSTSGNANPTFTIVALSLRLGEYLRNSIFQIPKISTPSTASKKKVLIIGAGLRVLDDIVPAFEANNDLFSIYRIYAHAERVIFGTHAVYPISVIHTLTAEDIGAASVIYIAVPTPSVLSTLEMLASHDCSHITLIIDTPAPLEQERKYYPSFARVLIAEDSVRIPWIDTLAEFTKQEKISLIRISFWKSIFRYHGIALSKAIDRACGGSGVIRTGITWGRTMWFTSTTGLVTSITAPREYPRGTIQIVAKNIQGKKSLLHIEMIYTAGYCTDFRINTMTTRLSKIESELIGIIKPSDTIVSCMLRIKRVGLYRMLRDSDKEVTGWLPQDAENDVRIDRTLHRLGVWFSL